MDDYIKNVGKKLCRPDGSEAFIMAVERVGPNVYYDILDKGLTVKVPADMRQLKKRHYTIK